jgi:hypothetical protein
MPALVAGIHVFLSIDNRKQDVDRRDISAFTRVVAALCPAMTPLIVMDYYLKPMQLRRQFRPPS